MATVIGGADGICSFHRRGIATFIAIRGAIAGVHAGTGAIDSMV